MILEGWREAIWSGRYTAARYDCASQSVAHWIDRLAKKAGLTESAFLATVQNNAEQIASLSPAAAGADPDLDKTKSSADREPAPGEQSQVVSAGPQVAPESAQVAPPEPPPAEDLETHGAAAERERAYREIFGIDEPKLRRRWRR